MKNSYCYLAEIRWGFDDEEKIHNCIIYADSYIGAMNVISHYYDENDILDIKLTYLNDMLFCIPNDKIEELKQFQEDI